MGERSPGGKRTGRQPISVEVRWLLSEWPSTGSDPIRRVAASGLVAIGVLAALFAGVFRYVDDHFHTPENFLANTETLADNADVRERLFNGFRTEIIALAEGEDLTAVDDATEEADDEDEVVEDSTPVTDAQIERDQAIEEILLDAFDSELYGQMFDEQLASVQAQVIRAAELPDEALLRDSGQVNFDARRLYPSIYEALAADPRTAEITQNAVPDTYGIYPIADRETTVNGVWWFVENGPSWRGLTFALAILSLIGAVAVAERRPSRVIQYGMGIVGLALVVVVVIYIVRAIVPLLASGGGSAGPVVATYAANLGPLVSVMFRLMIIGVVLAVVGGIAKLIWPDDWVYGHVTDERGSRSIRRRRGTPEPQPVQQPQQQVPVAAAVPVGYPPYGYPAAPGWGQPYPGQPYAPNPYQQYPVGPFAQPGAAAPQYTGRPTVPVTQLPADLIPTGETPQVDATANGSDRPVDAAQAVPRVVASAVVPDEEAAAEPAADATAAPAPEPSAPAASASADDDDWDNDGDW